MTATFPPFSLKEDNPADCLQFEMEPPPHQATPYPVGLRHLSTASPYTPATLASIKEYELVHSPPPKKKINTTTTAPPCCLSSKTIKKLQNENWQLKLRIFYFTQMIERFKPEDGFNINEVSVAAAVVAVVEKAPPLLAHVACRTLNRW